MSQPQPDLNQAYRTFQSAHTTEGNVIELLMNTVNKLNEELQTANQNNIQLRARVVELEQPVKKLDKATETVPVMPPGATPPKPKK